MSLTSIYTRIYNNIENVDLKAIKVLNEPVIQIHEILIGLKQDIEDIHNVLSRYSQSIQTKRFHEVIEITQHNCESLNEISQDLYSAQQAINSYHTTVDIFNDNPPDIIEFPPVEFSFPNIDVDTTRVLFNKEDLMQVWHALGVFNGNTVKRGDTLRKIPDNVAGWHDQQKDALQAVLNDVADRLNQIMAPFSDYRDYLGVIIINL